MDINKNITILFSPDHVESALQKVMDRVYENTFSNPWINEKKVLELFGYTNKQHFRGIAKANNIRISKPLKSYLYWRDDVFKFIENGDLSLNSVENREL